MEKMPSSNQVVTDTKPLTTFVKVDTTTFKEVVQRLTGPSSEHEYEAATTAKGNIGIKRPAFKLHERRQYKTKLEIIKPPPRSGNVNFQLSPLSTPTKCFSNLSLDERESAVVELNTEEEERAIRERRFYLHPSPRSKPGFSEPELLSLFPSTSPKTSTEL